MLSTRLSPKASCLSFLSFLVFLFSESYSQTAIQVYIDSNGKIYTPHQVDSIAGLGFPIANKKKSVKDDTTFIEFEILPIAKSLFVRKFEGKIIPDFNLTDIDGGKPDIQNKIVLINFWSTTCGPCIMEIPQLNELKRKYKDKVIFIGIAPEEPAALRNFLEKHEFEFIIVSDKRIFEEYEIDGYPKNLFINRDGVVVKAKEGTPFSKESGKWEVAVLEDYSKILSTIIAENE